MEADILPDAGRLGKTPPLMRFYKDHKLEFLAAGVALTLTFNREFRIEEGRAVAQYCADVFNCVGFSAPKPPQSEFDLWPDGTADVIVHIPFKPPPGNLNPEKGETAGPLCNKALELIRQACLRA